MNRQDSLQILQMCMDQLNSMTAEQFLESLSAKGLTDKKYDNNCYNDDVFSVETKTLIYIDKEENYQMFNNYSKQRRLFYGNQEITSAIISRGQAGSGGEFALAA